MFQRGYAALLAMVMELGEVIRPTYAENKERNQESVIHVRRLVQERLTKIEWNVKSMLPP